MGAGDKKDHNNFNCTQNNSYNELENRANKYKETEAVKKFLTGKCEDGTIKNWTHEKVINLLSENNFELA